MSSELILALAGFAFVTSITPGPNNLMLMASGANFGVRRTLRHMFGVAIGFVAMIVLVGLGVVAVFEAYPRAYSVLKVLSITYLLWLAWKIANAAAPGSGAAAAGSPLGFWQAAAFQWVNPKAWAMVLTAITAYAPDRSLGAVLLVAGVFGAVNLPSITLWTVLGQQVRRWLTTGGRLRAFNWTMAVLLILSLAPVIAK